MRWFGRDRPPDVWETGSQPDGDIEAAQRIREICAAASVISEKMATRRGRNAETQKSAEAERYQAAIKCALEVAKQMSDDGMREVSVSQIIRLCVKAGHFKTARVLLRAVQSDKIRDELIADLPLLTDQDAAS